MKHNVRLTVGGEVIIHTSRTMACKGGTFDEAMADRQACVAGAASATS